MKLFHYIKNQLRSESARNVAILTSGLSIAQAIPVVSMIVLTRLYPEEAFGIFFIYSSANIVLSIIATLRFQMSIVLPDDDNNAFQLLIVSLVISLVTALTALLLILFLHEWLVSLLNEKRISSWIYFFPLSMFLTGVFDSTNFWFNRKKLFKKISTGRVIRNSSLSISQIIFGIFQRIHIGLISGLIVGQFVSAIINLIAVLQAEKKKLSTLSLKNGLALIKTYRKIPLFNTAISLINNLSNQLPIFLLSNFYGVVISGYYGLANRVIAPMNMFGQSVGQVFFQKASDTYNQDGDLYGLVKRTYMRLFKLGIIPFLVLLLFAPAVFQIVFGASWETAGHYAQILIPWLLLSFLTSPVSYLVTVIGKQQKLTIYEIVLLASRFIALWTGYKLWDDVIYSIALYSAVGILFNLFLLFYYLKIAKHAIK